MERIVIMNLADSLPGNRWFKNQKGWNGLDISFSVSYDRPKIGYNAQFM